MIAAAQRNEFKTFRDKFVVNPRKADMVWTLLKRIFKVAKDGDLPAINPCAGGGRLYESDRNDKLWTEDHLVRLFAKCSHSMFSRRSRVAFNASATGPPKGQPFRALRDHPIFRGADPFSGALYVFRSKRADQIKAVWWDGSGVCLFAKTLENTKFC